MEKRQIPELYKQHGSFGNNTTIPEDERYKIAASTPEIDCEVGRLELRGEQAVHDFYKEWGIVPQGNWISYEDKIPAPHSPIWEKPIIEQRREQGILSKSKRNLQIFVHNKPHRARRLQEQLRIEK